MKLTFEKITKENRQKALDLKVAFHQINYIESVEDCLKEADQFACWQPVALVIDGVWIGFAMYCKWRENEEERVWLDRFLIDYRYQGKGYAHLVLDQLLPYLFDLYQCSQIFLSVYPDNQVAIHLYKSYGFQFNGERDIHDEWVMLLHKEKLKAALI